MVNDQGFILMAHKLHKRFVQGGKEIGVLAGVNIAFKSGCSYAITGVSGSGKSTLLHILGGLEEPSQGVVSWNEEDLALLEGGRKQRFLNHHVGFVFQFHYLIKELSAVENVMMMSLIRGDTKKMAYDHAMQLLEQVGLASKSTAYPHQLSGGEQQRVAVARAMMNKPSFVLADEPTANLDAHNAAAIIDLLLHAQRAWGMGIVVCTHDNEVYDRMDEVYRLHEGHLTLEKKE